MVKSHIPTVVPIPSYISDFQHFLQHVNRVVYLFVFIYSKTSCQLKEMFCLSSF